MILRAPAKINWILLVSGRRPDGYHEIKSPMQKVSLFDVLTFEKAPDLELVTDFDLPAEENLVYRAAALLKEKSGYRGGARIRLQKKIPVSAGLGGGSSDAAATLTGLNSLWRLGLDIQALMSLGGMLGSDVPFFIGPPAALAQGRGEELTPLSMKTPMHLLLVKPDFGVSAAWAYQNYRMLTKKGLDIKIFCQAFDRSDFGMLRKLAFNDLEQVVLPAYPVIGSIKERLVEAGAEISLMSGSGSTVFGVFRTSEDARKAAEGFKEFWYCVVDTIVDESIQR